MAELDLEIVLRTVLDAKGFEEAQSNLRNLAVTANATQEPMRGAAKAATQMSRDTTVNRVAVQDLSRNLLYNIGVTRGSSEAAKAAGASMLLMGGAITASSLGVMAAVGAISILIPHLIDWATSADDAAEATLEAEKATKALREEVRKSIPDLEAYAALLRTEAELKRAGYAPERLAQYQRETIELAQLRKEYLTWYDLQDKQVIPTNILSAEAFKVMRDRVADLEEAQKKGIPVQELYAARLAAGKESADAEKAAIKALMEAVDKANEYQMADARRVMDILDDKQKQAEEQAADALKDMRAHQVAQDKINRAAMLSEAQIFLARKRNEQEIEKIRKENHENEKLRRLQERAMWASIIAEGGRVITGLFGQNKKARIAQALLDAYASANLALATIPPPAGWVAAAISIAQGLANVAQIRKTEIGFDNPISDRLAAQLGVKFADDLVQLIGGGMSARLGEYTASRSIMNSTNIDRSVHIGSVSGVIGSRTQLRRYLTRELIKGQRAENRTRLS